MSTDYDLECATCGRTVDGWDGEPVQQNATAGVDDCREAASIARLLAIRPAMEQLGEVLASQDFYVGDINSTNVDRWAAFLYKHRGHDVAVWDEYGRRWVPPERLQS